MSPPGFQPMALGSLLGPVAGACPDRRVVLLERGWYQLDNRIDTGALSDDGPMDATERIDGYIDGLIGWQRDLARHLREQVHAADPGVDEDWKWDTPVFTARGKQVCAIGVFKDHVKVNFFKGASIADPEGLFNAGLEAKASRAIDLTETDQLDDAAFRRLVQAAIARNG
jgi:hypothetical protein